MSTARQPKGVPVGGQFAATAHTEPEASLVGVHIGGPREMTREELVITGQAVEGNPALSEATRQVHHSRLQLVQAIKAMDESLLSAAVVHAKQIHPGAKEMRLSDNRARPGHLETTSLTTEEGMVIRDDGSHESWAFNTIEGSDPADIYDAVTKISQRSAIWDTDPRCAYDPRTREYIVYLDGRRRPEH